MTTFPLDLIKRAEKGVRLSATDYDTNAADIEEAVNYLGVQLLSYYDDGVRTDTQVLEAAVSAMNILGKSLIIDQPLDLGGANVDCLGVSLVWLDRSNAITNGTLTNYGALSTPNQVKTIQELRDRFGLAENETVQVSGYYTSGDGGGGPQRVWKTGAVGEFVDNGGSIIVPTGGDGSGAWVWEWSGSSNVKWFGAKGDGVEDDTAAIQAAFNTVGAFDFILDDTYLTGPLQLKSDIKIGGVGRLLSTTKSNSFSETVSQNILYGDSLDNVEISIKEINGNVSTKFSATTVSYTELESLVEITNSTNITIDGVLFQDFQGQASTDGTSYQNSKRGVTYLLNCDGVEIINNEIGDNCYVEGLSVYESSNVAFRNNKSIQTATSYRISTPINCVGASNKNILIEDNILVGHGGSGMNVFALENVMIRNNVMDEGSGIDFSNEAGLTLTGITKNIFIYDNKMNADTDYSPEIIRSGLVIVADAGEEIQNVHVMGNLCETSHRTGLITRVKDFIIAGNTFSNCYGVTVNYGMSLSLDETAYGTVKDNKFFMPGNTSYGAGRNNLFIRNSSKINICDNVFVDADINHISFETTPSTDVLINGNRFEWDVNAPSENIAFAPAADTSTVQIIDNHYQVDGNLIDMKLNTNFSQTFQFKATFTLSVADDSIIRVLMGSCRMFRLKVSTFFTDEYIDLFNNNGVFDTVLVGSKAEVGTGTPTGTTGTDDFITIYPNSQNFYIENRSNGTRTFIVTIEN